MRVIETRYRDIPFEEVIKCSFPGMVRDDGAEIWSNYRARPVQIHVPADGRAASHTRCDGPHFRVVGKTYSICPHIAEIGD